MAIDRMLLVYFDSSVFLSILNGDSSAKQVKDLLTDLQKAKARIYTSIVTVQEVSVNTYKKGTVTRDNHGAVKKLARIMGVTRDIALTAAKIEAHVLDSYKDANAKSEDNKRRKWDCFHIATAQHLRCTCLYSFDAGMLARRGQLRITGMEFSEPCSLNRDLLSDLD